LGAKVPGNELARVLSADSLQAANWPGSEEARYPVILCLHVRPAGRPSVGATENARLENAAPDSAGVENAGVAQYGKPKSPLFNIVTSVLQQPLGLM